MSRTWKERKPVPPTGGPMRAKQERRRRTRGAQQAEWLEEYLDEQDAILADLQAISDEAEGYWPNETGARR